MTGIPYQQGYPTTLVTLDATFENGTMLEDPTGIQFRLRKPDGTLSVYVYGTDPNVTRLGVGMYECALTLTDAGQYHYEAVGTGTVAVTLPGEFIIIPSSVDVPAEVPGPVLGPGRTWINGEDLGQCPGLDLATQGQLADAVAVEASMVLYELSARQFPGLCGPVTVRPTREPSCNCWSGDFMWGGYTWTWLDSMGGWSWSGDQGNLLYGCGYVSRTKLQGYPVREIVNVKIDGNILPTSYLSGAPTYRLDSWKYLVRMDDPSQPQQIMAWPGCQNLGLDDDQPSTWSVTYTYGVDPPPLGIEAAKQLACQLSLAVAGKPCELPVGATKVTRQGVVIERGLLATWGYNRRLGQWQTGLALVDSFLNVYNGAGLRRRPAVLSPDIGQFAPVLGEQ